MKYLKYEPFVAVLSGDLAVVVGAAVHVALALSRRHALALLVHGKYRPCHGFHRVESQVCTSNTCF